MNDKIPSYIEEQVNDYKNETYELLDYIKIVCFAYLVKKISYKDFTKKLEAEFSKYDARTAKRFSKDFKSIEEMAKEMNDAVRTPIDTLKPNEKDLDKLLFKLDKTSTKTANDIYIKRIKDFYKGTEKTLKKEYINANAYLSKKVGQYDKIQKVIAYRNKDGTVRAYFDIASYNSMVYNTNLTSTAWNATIENAKEVGNDLVYVEPHPFSCPLCQEWQGKIYALSNNHPVYPNIEEAIKGGLKHPNCKHNITEYYGQKETDIYTSNEWADKYQARQKKQSLELERKRLKNDRNIYKELKNNEEVDNINNKIRKLNSKIKEQKEIIG